MVARELLAKSDPSKEQRDNMRDQEVGIQVFSITCLQLFQSSLEGFLIHGVPLHPTSFLHNDLEKSVSIQGHISLPKSRTNLNKIYIYTYVHLNIPGKLGTHQQERDRTWECNQD